MNPIILDTDPGIDDAVAFIVLHHFCPERVKLILASYGNSSIDHTLNNALTMRGLLHWDVPVVRGAENPCDKQGQDRLVDAAHVHGADGLGGLGLSFPEGEAFAGDFLQRVYDTLCALGRADYITLGPLTNLALLLKRFPDARAHIGRVVSMGGAIGLGNVTPEAEFNIHCDPAAAAYVLRELPDVALVPLNVTNSVAFSLEEIDRITRGGGEVAEAMRKILTSNYHACVRYGETGSTMHDSTAVLCYLFPELFTVRRCGIDVDSGGHYGRTSETAERENVTLAVSTDAEKLLRLIGGCVAE